MTGPSRSEAFSAFSRKRTGKSRNGYNWARNSVLNTQGVADALAPAVPAFCAGALQIQCSSLSGLRGNGQKIATVNDPVLSELLP